MGDVTRVLITGATGFIGRATVTEAKASGLEVVAIGSDDVDLSKPDASAHLRARVQGCQAVIHLAAAMGGDAEAHERITIQGTRAVLDAMKTVGISHLVLASSLAVYRLEAVAQGHAIQSDTAIDTPDTARDAYAAAKATQEHLAQEAGLKTLAILRPGIVYDDTHLWNAHLGIGVGPLFFRFALPTRLPMCHVAHLAKRLVAAATKPMAQADLVCDPELPTRGMVLDRLRGQGWSKIEVPFPETTVRLIAKLLSPVAGKLPGLLRTRVLEQRLYPIGRISAEGGA